MHIPAFFTVGTYRVFSLLIFVAIGLLVSALVIWFEGKRDGFDEESLFDVFLISVLAGLIFFYISIKSSLYNYFGNVSFTLTESFLVGLLPVYILSRIWKWSVYRVLDIFVIAFCVGSCVPILGFALIYRNPKVVFVLAGFAFVAYLFSLLRISRLFSGIIFSIFLFIISAVGLIFFYNVENLAIYAILTLLGIINIYSRGKSDMAQENLPLNLINSLKQKLLSRRKSLKAEQKLLDVEDPHLNNSHNDESSENMDEAILNDSLNEVTDARKTSVLRALVDVRRALAKMKIGKYGVCDICGKTIDRARLMAYPEATTCLEDADKQKS